MILSDMLINKRSGSVPVWMMRQAGRYLPEYRSIRSRKESFLDLCFDPQSAAEVTLQPLHRFDFDAAILFSDILVIPYALGQNVRFDEKRGPILSPLDIPAPCHEWSFDICLPHLRPVLETLSLVRKKLPPEKDLIGFCGGPWTLSTYMVAGQGETEQKTARLAAYRDPEGFSTLISTLTRICTDFLSAQVDAGATVLQIFDSWAGLIAEEQRQLYSVQPIASIVQALKKRHPNVPVILFSRGIGSAFTDFLSLCPLDAVGIDHTVSLRFAREKLQPHIAVQGNLDPVLLLAGGSELKKSSENILRALSHGPFVFNLGHGILPHTPLEHVHHVVDVVKKWNQTHALSSL